MLYFNVENRATGELWSVPHSICNTPQEAITQVAFYYDNPEELEFTGISGEGHIDNLVKYIEEQVHFAKEFGNKFNAREVGMQRSAGAVEFFINQLCTDRYEKRVLEDVWNDFYLPQFRF